MDSFSRGNIASLRILDFLYQECGFPSQVLQRWYSKRAGILENNANWGVSAVKRGTTN